MKDRKYKVRLLSIILTMVMVITSMGLGVFADADDDEDAVEKISAPTELSFTGEPAQKFAEGTKNLGADNLVTLKWEEPKSGNVKSYTILNEKKKVLRIEDEKYSGITETRQQFRALPGKHKYYVKAISADDPSDFAISKPITIDGGVKFINTLHKKFDWKVTFRRNVALYKSATGSATIKKVSKGTTAIAIGKYPRRISGWNKPKRVKVQFEDGSVGWTQWGTIRFRPLIRVKQDYPASLKEDYVNKFSSRTNYLVWVNEYTQRVNVFKGKKGSWKLVRTFRCTTGSFAQPVVKGHKYRLGARRGTVWRLDEQGRSYYFKLARGFHGGGYFHTRCWWASGRVRNSVGNRPTTRGCIRMHNPDAAYIYKLPTNSKVVIR